MVRLFPGSTRVRFEATMRNIDVKPRRWGIWTHTQLDGAGSDPATPNTWLKSWCPLSPRSHFTNGYAVIFGAPDNPSFRPDPRRQLMRVQYMYQVGMGEAPGLWRVGAVSKAPLATRRSRLADLLIWEIAGLTGGGAADLQCWKALV
ncbi:MAG TPA: hypothetical protein PKM43_16640 [Verrucomicrobiota bacterium]|nr:hypothetical protein [Verrucomicrobiota bacterium]HRZ37617.1 hypothetical protein [Candidatus Paceibacterota bacterium]